MNEDKKENFRMKIAEKGLVFAVIQYAYHCYFAHPQLCISRSEASTLSEISKARVSNLKIPEVFLKKYVLNLPCLDLFWNSPILLLVQLLFHMYPGQLIRNNCYKYIVDTSYIHSFTYTNSIVLIHNIVHSSRRSASN